MLTYRVTPNTTCFHARFCDAIDTIPSPRSRAMALIYRRLWWCLGWIWIVAVMYLTLTPAPPTDPLSLPFADKLAHALAFLWLMWWFAQLVTGRSRPWVGAALVGLGVVIEFLQRLGGVRHFEVADMLADGLGVVLGWWLATGPLGRALWRWDRFLAIRFSHSRGEEKT